MHLSDILEAAMLVCFGASWPFSILKAVRTRVVRGKSPVFLSLILAGYVAGVGKMLAAWSEARAAVAPGQTVPVPWLLWFYLALLVLVATDTILYLRYRRNA